MAGRRGTGRGRRAACIHGRRPRQVLATRPLAFGYKVVGAHPAVWPQTPLLHPGTRCFWALKQLYKTPLKRQHRCEVGSWRGGQAFACSCAGDGGRQPGGLRGHHGGGHPGLWPLQCPVGLWPPPVWGGSGLRQCHLGIRHRFCPGNQEAASKETRSDTKKTQKNKTKGWKASGR